MTNHADALIVEGTHVELPEVVERPSNEDIAEAAHGTGIFDARFAATAVVVGIAYCMIVVAIRRFVSAEAGGIAGVTLTTLAVAVFRRFETLRFASTKTAAVIGIPQLSIAYLSVVVFAFLGMQISAGLGVGFIILLRSAGNPLSILQIMTMFNSTTMLIVAIAVVAILHGAAGALTGRVSVYVPGVTYTYVVLASLIVSAINAFPLVAGAIVNRDFSALKDGFSNFYFLTWLVYVATAFVGAYLGLLSRSKSAEEYVVVKIGGA